MPVKYWLGKKLYPHMVEALRKSAMNRTGKKHPLWKGGGGLLECPYCEEKFRVEDAYAKKIRKFCSFSCRSRYHRKFDKAHHNWKGGVTPVNERIRHSLEYKEWQKKVFERDDYTCQICGERGGILNSNHIKKFSDYPEIRFDLGNGITLCKECHFELVNRHELEWESYFNFNLETRRMHVGIVHVDEVLGMTK